MEKNEKKTNSYAPLIQRYNEMANRISSMPAEAVYQAFGAMGQTFANMPQIQNRRIKGISSLPFDYTKEDIGEFLRNPYVSEKPLRQTAQTLKWTAYPFFKIAKTYQDIPTYRYLTKPLYLSAEDAESKEFLREFTLLDKFSKTLRPDICAHKITGEAITLGKVFYTLRAEVDKIHGSVSYAFMQQLPSDFCHIVGYNNVSGYTVSFDMMYFLQPGTDVTQFGDLFLPYIDDFSKIFRKKKKDKFVYASKEENFDVFPENYRKGMQGNPRMFMQNGRWFYYISLPIDSVWTFEIDDTTPAVASPLAGLMLTYAQQSDYEAAQLSLILNPLIKIFTGEIPYFDDDGSRTEDTYKLSQGGRFLFESLFAQMMASSNTGGTAFFTAPVENIKSHDFSESANANEISESFNRYGMEKAGLSSLLPVAEDVKAAQVDASMKIESRFSSATIYAQFERMMNSFYRSLSLRYDFSFHMFGTIFNEKGLRENAEKQISRGDLTGYLTEAALDGESILDKLSSLRMVKAWKMTSIFEIPETAYTQSAKTGGRPKSDDLSEAKEKSMDAGYSEVDI
ncbi:MAG: hypothetical protein IJ489_08790 [Clostridia bacterium]|nr:hypothetical protein [Clostridia bacterium]